MKTTQFKLVPLTNGMMVYDKLHKSFGTVIDNFNNPINGDRGEIRLDSDGMCAIFEYDTDHNRIGYSLVRIQDMSEAELLAACKEMVENGGSWPFKSTTQRILSDSYMAKLNQQYVDGLKRFVSI